MRQASCHHAYQDGDWCWGIPDWGSLDQGCAKPAYWSTMSNEAQGDYAIYIHHGKIDPSTPNSKGIYGLATYKEEVCGDGVSTGYSLNGLRYRVNGSGCYEEIAVDPETGMRKAGGFRDLAANIDYEALPSARLRGVVPFGCAERAADRLEIIHRSRGPLSSCRRPELGRPLRRLHQVFPRHP